MSVALAIVVPCYNEEEVLPETMARLLALLDTLCAAGQASEASALCFVDDGSRDRTWELIQEGAQRDGRVRGVKLSRNSGHQNALLAGLSVAQADAVVTIDADLQDDLNVIHEMLQRHAEGCDIVYGVRRSRASDSMGKRGGARAYYHLLRLLGVEIVFDHADYRLMSRRAIGHLQEYAEVNLFLRGIIPMLGFQSAIVRYDRAARFAGTTKYPLRRMLALGVNGITSFSVAPLRAIALLGMLIFVASLAMVCWVLYGKLVMDTAIPGWASSVIPVYFLGGTQLLSIGVLGEYVAKMYLETKRRPRFFIESTV
jgi:glycosyltransferase involved in cell wall biosynthesis